MKKVLFYVINTNNINITDSCFGCRYQLALTQLALQLVASLVEWNLPGPELEDTFGRRQKRTLRHCTVVFSV